MLSVVGICSLAKSLSQQLAPESIRVNNLVPGSIFTDRIVSLDAARAEAHRIPVEQVRAEKEAAIPWGRYGTKDEFGKAGAFLLSEAP